MSSAPYFNTANGSVRDYIICHGKPWLVGEQLFPLTADTSQGENECPMNLQFTLLADYAILDTGGKLSVLGIFDQIKPPVLPFALPMMYWVTSIQGEASEAGRVFPIEFLLWDPDGTQLFANEGSFAFNPPAEPGLRPSHNAVVGLAGIVFARPGDHAFIVRIMGEERGRAVLRVNPPLQLGAGTA